MMRLVHLPPLQLVVQRCHRFFAAPLNNTNRIWTKNEKNHNTTIGIDVTPNSFCKLMKSTDIVIQIEKLGIKK